MIKVITYGTFDLLHQGHINILKRAKALGDYLYVGVTTENFDITRGKINVRQSLIERMEAVKATGLADEVFPEEYEGQKIDDVRRNNIDIFVLGSDWIGKFDYLREYCQVVYLPRTEGVSSSQLREEQATVGVGVVGEDPTLLKLKEQSQNVNGIQIDSICTEDSRIGSTFVKTYDKFDGMLADVDAVYAAVRPEQRADYILRALNAGKHVISESPIALSKDKAKELFDIAEKNKLVLFDSIKTAYALPYSRMILLLKSGIIGDIKSIETTCTSLENSEWLKKTNYYSSLTGWGSTGILPILQILGRGYRDIKISTLSCDGINDAFSKVNFIYENSLATVNVGVGVKAEGDMRISGTKGYIYVPAPWWMSPFFEVKYEDSRLNKPYYYKNDDGGLQSELVHFINCIKSNNPNYYISRETSECLSEIMELYTRQAK